MKKRPICEEWARANWKIRIGKQKLARIVLAILIIFIVLVIFGIMKM